jgi:hypothetical protein
VHNTQPWRFTRQGNVLTMHLDRGRQLTVLDPAGRQLVISCGCALFNARVSAASDGFNAFVERFPDSPTSDVFARMSVTAIAETDERAGIAPLDGAIFSRRTNRRPFYQDPVPPDVVKQLTVAAAEEGAVLMEIIKADHRTAIAQLAQRADGVQNANRAYRAELRDWITADPGRLDGVAVEAVPRVDGQSEDEVPIRDFDSFGLGQLPAGTHSSSQQCLLLLGTYSDSPEAWVRAGEALEHILLEIAARGFAASPLTQIIEVPQTREALRTELGLTMYPHVLLRVGRATSSPASRRRLLSEVFTEQP